LTRKELIQLNFLATLVGLGAGFAAIGFRYMIGAFQNITLHNKFDYNLISPLGHVRGEWIFVILPAGLLLSNVITRFFAREATGHGVPEVIESVWTKSGKMRKRVVAVKAIASSITIASGGSVGREGPIVQIGSAFGSAIGQILKMKPKIMKTLVGCGAAGAVAATFNTPIAGVIFAIEVIVLELKTKSFVPLVISSVFATVVSRVYIGNEPAFFVPEYALKSPQELLFYMLLGILSGIVGVLVIKTLYGVEDFVDSIKAPFWTKPIVIGLMLAGMGQYFPEIYGVGYETTSQVLQQNSYFTLMFSLVFLKTIAMSLTIAAGGSGGVFAPSLFIGAMLGGSFGVIVNQFFPDFTGSYGAYALVGMAAMFSATARATFTAIVILFEMTLDYSIILPLMFVCVAADQTAWALSKDTIYSMKLRRKGLNFVTDISADVMQMTCVKDIMTTELDVIKKNMSFNYVVEKLLPHNHSAYPVVDSDGVLKGIVTKTTLERYLQLNESPKIEDLMVPAKAVVSTDESVSTALAKIEKTRDPRILVVEKGSQKLVGIVSPIDFVRLNSNYLADQS
ncbi:MAG: chloride channel protein, partial [Bdellovibrionales bacterium]|nr:chloride channel protein [Bdellovibrionales bacterium]